MMLMDVADIEIMIQNILARLKYQELPQLMGRSIHVSSAETAPVEVLVQCQDVLPLSTEFCQPELEVRRGTIRQYGILDLTYSIDPAELQPIILGGESLVQNLGLFQDIESMIEFDGGWEADLWEDLSQGKAYVRLFLRTWEELLPEEREYRRIYGVPTDFFIPTYKILDAAFTNSAWVWFLKHFYA